LNFGLAELVLVSLESDLVQLAKLKDQHAAQDHARQFAAPQSDGLPWRQIIPAKVLKELQSRDLGNAVFQEGICSFIFHPIRPPVLSVDLEHGEFRHSLLVLRLLLKDPLPRFCESVLLCKLE